MKRPADRLDPALFTVAPHVAVLDEFRMTNDDGSFVADITPAFLDRLVKHMNEREAATGDLCPGVIGHTQDGVPETAQPPVTAYCRNWVVDDLFETGRKAAFCDVWVYKQDVDLVRKYPRRSAEVWVSRYEIDPLSFLGATTPSRDLGLMKLSRDGSLTYECPGDMTMPSDDKKTPADEKETGASKGMEGKLDQILAALTKLTDSLAPPAAPAPAGAPASGATPPAADTGGEEMGDEEFNALMKELEGGGGAAPDEKSRKGEEPEKQGAGPGVNNTHVQLSRADADELGQLRLKLARNDVKTTLFDLRYTKSIDVDPADESLVADLAALPDDMRARQIDRLVKLSRTLPNKPSPLFDTAVNSATDGRKRVTTPDEHKAVIKLARTKEIDYKSAAQELGYAV